MLTQRPAYIGRRGKYNTSIGSGLWHNELLYPYMPVLAYVSVEIRLRNVRAQYFK